MDSGKPDSVPVIWSTARPVMRLIESSSDRTTLDVHDIDGGHGGDAESDAEQRHDRPELLVLDMFKADVAEQVA